MLGGLLTKDYVHREHLRVIRTIRPQSTEVLQDMVSRTSINVGKTAKLRSLLKMYGPIRSSTRSVRPTKALCMDRHSLAILS